MVDGLVSQGPSDRDHGQTPINWPVSSLRYEPVLCVKTMGLPFTATILLGTHFDPTEQSMIGQFNIREDQ